MKLGADDGDFLEISAADSGGGAFDVLLIVGARFRGFTASIDVWVSRTAWMAFVQELVVLEECRQGWATLEGISPGELSLVIRSTDRAGHMGVEATLGARGYDYRTSLQFDV